MNEIDIRVLSDAIEAYLRKGIRDGSNVSFTLSVARNAISQLVGETIGRLIEHEQLRQEFVGKEVVG